MTDLVWEDPPKSSASRKAVFKEQWDKILDQLETKPGEWARLEVFEKAPRAATVRNSLVKRYSQNHEFTVRKMQDGTFGLYGRYIGGEQ